MLAAPLLPKCVPNPCLLQDGTVQVVAAGGGERTRQKGDGVHTVSLGQRYSLFFCVPIW